MERKKKDILLTNEYKSKRTWNTPEAGGDQRITMSYLKESEPFSRITFCWTILTKSKMELRFKQVDMRIYHPDINNKVYHTSLDVIEFHEANSMILYKIFDLEPWHDA
jgi:hypothetical protein